MSMINKFMELLKEYPDSFNICEDGIYSHIKIPKERSFADYLFRYRLQLNVSKGEHDTISLHNDPDWSYDEAILEETYDKNIVNEVKNLIKLQKIKTKNRIEENFNESFNKALNHLKETNASKN